MADKKLLKVLKIEPCKHPEVVEIENKLESWQQGVGGYIECVYPFEDEVAMIVNEEGKLNCLPLNRCLKNETGEIYDIIAGNILIVGLTDDDFDSLTDEMIEKYEKMFHKPEVFVRIDGKIRVLYLDDEPKGVPEVEDEDEVNGEE